MEHLLRTSRLDFSGILGNSMAVIKTGAARLIPLALLSAIPQAIMLTLTQANYFSQSSSDSLAPLCALCGLELVFFVLIMVAYIAQAYTVEASSPPSPRRWTSQCVGDFQSASMTASRHPGAAYVIKRTAPGFLFSYHSPNSPILPIRNNHFPTIRRIRAFVIFVLILIPDPNLLIAQPRHQRQQHDVRRGDAHHAGITGIGDDDHAIRAHRQSSWQ